MLVLAPSQRLTNPEPKFQHRLHSPNLRTLSLIHQSSSHPSETYLLGSSGRTQRESSLSRSLMQPLISFFRRITHCRGTCCDHLRAGRIALKFIPSQSIHSCTRAHQHFISSVCGLPLSATECHRGSKHLISCNLRALASNASDA